MNQSNEYPGMHGEGTSVCVLEHLLDSIEVARTSCVVHLDTDSGHHLVIRIEGGRVMGCSSDLPKCSSHAAIVGFAREMRTGAFDILPTKEGRFGDQVGESISELSFSYLLGVV